MTETLQRYRYGNPPIPCLRIFSLLLAILILPQSSDAVVTAPTHKNKQESAPEYVGLGIFVRSIHNINYKDGTVEIDIFLYAETDKNSNPLETLEIMNAEVKNKSNEGHSVINGKHLFSERLDLLARVPYDLSAFPLDTQHLVLIFEDIVKDSRELLFYEHSSSRVGKSVALPGYDIQKHELEITVFEHIGGLRALMHATPQGLPPTILYSRATFRVPIVRQGYVYYVKLFVSVFLAAAVAFLSFYIKPTNVDPRFGLGVAAIFAVVASNYVLSSILPDTHELSLGESILFVTYVAIFVTLAMSVYSLHLYEVGKEAVAKRVDRAGGIVGPILYVAAMASLVLFSRS